MRQITQPIYEEITRDVRIHETELSRDVKENLEKEYTLYEKRRGRGKGMARDERKKGYEAKREAKGGL